MTPDNDALEEKRRWLEQIARDAVPGLAKHEMESLISTLCTTLAT